MSKNVIKCAQLHKQLILQTHKKQHICKFDLHPNWILWDTTDEVYEDHNIIEFTDSDSDSDSNSDSDSDIV